MNKPRQLLHTLVLATLLLLAQWASTAHALELVDEAQHYHSVDCSVCLFDSHAQAVSTVAAANPQIAVAATPAAVSAAFSAPEYSFRAIRAPPR